MKSPQSPHLSSLWVFALSLSSPICSSPIRAHKSLEHYTFSTVLLIVGLRFISLWLGKARSHTSLTRYILVCLSSPSIYLFPSCLLYILYVSSFATLRLFLYVSSSVPHLCLPSFHLSLSYPSVNPTLVIPYYPYDPFLIILINPILTTPHTCINTLATSCCSPV